MFPCGWGSILDNFRLACKKGELGASLPSLPAQATEVASASWE